LSPRPIEFPVDGLSDGVVHLRLIAEADIPAILDAVQDPEIPRWTRVPDPYSEEDGRHFHRMASTGREAGTDLATVIVDADDRHLLGTVALHNIDPENGRCTSGTSSESSFGSTPRTPRRFGWRRWPAFTARACCARSCRSGASAATCSCTRSCRASSGGRPNCHTLYLDLRFTLRAAAPLRKMVTFSICGFIRMLAV